MKDFNDSGQVPDGWQVIANTERGTPSEHQIKEKVLVMQKAVLEGNEISGASTEQDIKGGGRSVVTFQLNDNGSKQFDEAAFRLYHRADTQGEPRGLIAIILDGNIVSMPVVNAEHFGGHGTISGSFTKESAHDLAIMLRSGSLPVPIGRLAIDPKTGEVTKVPKEPESESFVGPSLGQDSIMRGMTASIVAIILVALFMIVYYRAGGIVSVIGLVLNLVWLLAIMALFGATMTLPGIAGIVLTIGMAVDANIIIYERVREEMAKGKSASQAFDAGYDRAFVTIVDANVTTMLAGLVLYYFGTGPIQGFAVTLVIGIVTTLLSVLWACKVIEKQLVVGGTITKWSMMQLFKTPSIDFVKLAKPCMAISAIVVIASAAVFFARGKEQFGIEFTGGTALSFTFSAPVDIGQVRDSISNIKEGGVPKYADAEIQTLASVTTDISKMQFISGANARDFQLRTRASDPNVVRNDIQAAFTDPSWKGAAFSREPFQPVDTGKDKDVPANERWATPEGGKDGTPGNGFFVYMADDGKLDFAVIATKIGEALKDAKDVQLSRDSSGTPIFGGDKGAGILERAQGSSGSLAKVKILFLKSDCDAPNGVLEKAREALKALATGGGAPFRLATDPFTSVQTIGPAVASQLLNSTILALIISWALMIVYIALRFKWFIFGVAAVVALIHDAIISIGFTSLAGWIIPKSWGLSFEMNMSTVAAILAIIGYSVNDTIINFDRIRENLSILKKDKSFTEIVNLSINETIGRSVLTSFTVWITCVILYAFTMTSAGGIASFAFPMLMGVVVGTYSSIYIASPLVLMMFRGQRPQGV
jgi:SecD/SecF fusion protein